MLEQLRRLVNQVQAESQAPAIILCPTIAAIELFNTPTPIQWEGVKVVIYEFAEDFCYVVPSNLTGIDDIKEKGKKMKWRL